MNPLMWQQKRYNDIDNYLGCTGFTLSNIDLCVHKYRCINVCICI